MSETKLFSGTANRPLAQAIASQLGVSLERTEIGRFSDGEIRVELRDNVRGSKAFIIQPTCAPANDMIMELMLLADALHRSAAKEIIAVIPYYGYARQDRRPGYSRTPITARIVANMIETTQIKHIVTMDMHTTQIQGFYNLPVDNLSASRLFLSDIKANHTSKGDCIIVSPDIGGVPRARAIAKSLGLDLAIIDKRRPKANVSEVMNIIGDIEGRRCIMVDDLIDTAGTLCHAADALVEAGAESVVAYCTHPVLSGSAIMNLNNSKLAELVVTDTIPMDPRTSCPKVRVISTAEIFAETIRRLDNGKSISELSN